MSVITSHFITPTSSELNLKNYLLENGYVHEADLYSPKRKASVHFDYVLDYKKCNLEKAMEIRKQYKERYDRNDVEYTEESLDQLLLMPVYFQENGAMGWNLNYYSDDSPSIILGSLFPEEIFIYSEYTEGRLNGSCYFKGETGSCTKSGKKIENYISNISPNLIKKVNSYQYRISLPLFPTDKFFATIYLDNELVQPVDILDYDTKTTIYTRKNLCILDKTKEIPVYRILKDGTKKKEYLSWETIKNNYQFCKEEYQNLQELNDKFKKDVTMDELYEIDDIEME